jgi:hypothetical protein
MAGLHYGDYRSKLVVHFKEQFFCIFKQPYVSAIIEIV